MQGVPSALPRFRPFPLFRRAPCNSQRMSGTTSCCYFLLCAISFPFLFLRPHRERGAEGTKEAKEASRAENTDVQNYEAIYRFSTASLLTGRHCGRQREH